MIQRPCPTRVFVGTDTGPPTIQWPARRERLVRVASVAWGLVLGLVLGVALVWAIEASVTYFGPKPAVAPCPVWACPELYAWNA